MFTVEVASQKHFVLYDRRHQFVTVIEFRLALETKQQKQPEAPRLEEQKSSMLDENKFSILNKQASVFPTTFTQENIAKLTYDFWMENPFTMSWTSEYFTYSEEQNLMSFGEVPYSLDTFLDMYKDPRKHSLKFKPKFNIPESLIKPGTMMGTLKLNSTFHNNPTRFPFRSSYNHSDKHVILISYNSDETVLCSGTLIEKIEVEQMDLFQLPQNAKPGGIFSCLHYEIPAVVHPKHIVFLKGYFKYEKLMAGTAEVVLVAPVGSQIEKIPNLKDILSRVSNTIELRNIMILMNVFTDIEQAEGIVFYDTLCNLYQRLMKSYLFCKVQDEWMIHGMATYQRNDFYYLHDIFHQLCDLVQKGQEFAPLIDDEYACDEVWRLKATVLYYVFAHLSEQDDRLTHGLISTLKEGKKVDTNHLIKAIKNKKWKSIRRTYQKQFIKGTGISRLTYCYEYTKKNENKIRFKIRQKSLQAFTYQFYNLTRIKLEQNFDCKSPIIEKIIQKNSRPEFNTGRRRDNLEGPLLVPARLDSQPFVRATLPAVIVQTSLQQDNEDKQNHDIQIQKKNETKDVTSNMMGKKKAPLKKAGEKEPAAQPGWMKMDPNFTFLCALKNGDQNDRILLQQLIRERAENELFKVIKSARSKHFDIGVTKQLTEMIEIKEDSKTSIQIKMEILDMYHLILAQTNDRKLWENMLKRLRLYEPPCYDRSMDGFKLKIALVTCIGRLKFRNQFSSYFDEFHRILIAMSQDSECLFSHKEEVDFRKALYRSMLNWNTRFVKKVLKEMIDVVSGYLLELGNYIPVMRVIIQRAHIYLENLGLDPVEYPEVRRFTELLDQAIVKDRSNRLWLARFSYSISKVEKEEPTLNFFSTVFEHLEEIRVERRNIYAQSLKIVKDLLLKNRKKYALDMQMGGLNPDQNYFIAEKLWEYMTTGQSLYDPVIRLYFMKIYRIIYFYFTPVCLIHKLKNLGSQQYDFQITSQQRDEILQSIKDFAPDRNWFTGYDTHVKKGQKDHDGQEQQHHPRAGPMGKTAFMKKVKETKTEFKDFGSNLIARYAMENQDKDLNWMTLSKRCLDQVIKELIAKRLKNQVVLELKSLRKKLKPNKKPQNYSFDDFKVESVGLLQKAGQSTHTMQTLIKQTEGVLEKVVRHADTDTKLILPAHIFLNKEWKKEASAPKIQQAPELPAGMEIEEPPLKTVPEAQLEEEKEDNNSSLKINLSFMR